MIGLDYLGLGSKHWKVEESLQAFPDGWALGCFGGTTFGKLALTNVRRFLQSGKVKAFRLQAWWDNGHKIAPLEFLKKELPKWEALHQEFPGIPFYISHSCEYSEKSIDQIRLRVDAIKRLCPSCIPVQTPMHSPVIPGYMTEEHGQNATAKAGQIASTDGQSIYDIDAERWMAANVNAEITFLWGARFNLRDGTPNMPPPPERKAYPDFKYIQSIVRLAYPKGAKPDAIFESTPIKKPMLYKTHGEDGPGDANRDNRPLIMLPKRSDKVEVVTFSGASIGKFIYFGAYPNGTFRFYSGLPGGMNLYGFEIAERLRQISGYEWGWFKQGSKFYGPVHFAFRRGYFQK